MTCITIKEILDLICLRRCCKETVEELEIGRLIGTGGFSQVFECKSRQLAIKVTPVNKPQSQFRNEVEILCMLSHPGIVQLVFNIPDARFHRGCFSSRVSVVGLQLARCSMVDVMDQDLDDMHLPIEVALDLFLQLAEALDYCHEQGVSHLDVKPANLLVSQTFGLLLSDFGCASSALTCRTRRGTPMYMAPEVAGRRRYEGQKADVWSAAVCLFNFATGLHPFSTCDLKDPFYRAVIEQKWDKFWKLFTSFNYYNQAQLKPVPVLNEIFTRAMVADPDERPSFSILLQDFARYRQPDKSARYLRTMLGFGQTTLLSASRDKRDTLAGRTQSDLQTV
jgi:serine/threonine protein kinase